MIPARAPVQGVIRAALRRRRGVTGALHYRQRVLLLPPARPLRLRHHHHCCCCSAADAAAAPPPRALASPLRDDERRRGGGRRRGAADPPLRSNRIRPVPPPPPPFLDAPCERRWFSSSGDQRSSPEGPPPPDEVRKKKGEEEEESEDAPLSASKEEEEDGDHAPNSSNNSNNNREGGGPSAGTEIGTAPPLTAAAKKVDRETNARILRAMLSHVWPSDGTAIARRRRRRVAASLGLMLAGKAVTIQVPFVFKSLVDSLPAAAAGGGDAAAAAAAVDPSLAAALPVSLLLGYGVARAASSGFQEWRNAVFAVVAQDAIRNVGRTVFDHVHGLDLQFHLSRNTGQLSRVLDRGQRSISFVLNAMVFHVGPTLLEVALVTALMAHQCGPAHAAVVLATVSSYAAFTFAVTSWRTRFRREMNRLENQASGRVVDSLLNYETVQYFNNARHEGERYESSLRGYQHAALDAQRSLSFLNFGQAAIFSAGLTSVMWLTSHQILQGAATVGDLVLVNGLLFQLSVPLFFIGSVYREVRQAFIDMEAMFKLRDTKPAFTDREDAVQYNADTMGTSLSFEDVRFAYPTAANERPILNGASFDIPQGKTVAFVGSSGCGKSTVLRLLYRFYQPDSGTIRVGGRDVEDLAKDSLQRAIAVVPQDTVLFHDTIAYNIQYGDLNASWHEVEDAAKKAKIHDTILSFPEGYETVVGERGLKLSGGEKQRVAIARAILKKAPILLCDEPTSSLDSETETDIMSNLKSIGSDRTTVIIAHRLSTIQDCDEILVMHLGQVVERGTHEELLRLNGRYTELLKMQERMDEEEADQLKMQERMDEEEADQV